MKGLLHRNGKVAKLRSRARQGLVTLIYSAHDEVHNDAIVPTDLQLERGVVCKQMALL